MGEFQNGNFKKNIRKPDEHFIGVYKKKYVCICFDKYFTNVSTILSYFMDNQELKRITENGERGFSIIFAKCDYV